MGDNRSRRGEKVLVTWRECWSLGVFYLGALLYLEITFHLVQFRSINGSFVCSWLFLVPTAAGMMLASSFGKRGIRMAIAYVLQSAVCLVYIAQHVYCYIFKTYLSVFSVTTGTGQILEFWREALHGIWRSLPFILLFALPVAALAGYWYLMRRLSRQKEKPVTWETLAEQVEEKREQQTGDWKMDRRLKGWLWRAGMLAGAVLLHFAVVASLPLQGRDYYTPYDLYHFTPAMDISVRKLGLLTTTRLDAKWLVFGMKEVPVWAEEEPEDWGSQDTEEDDVWDPTLGESEEPETGVDEDINAKDDLTVTTGAAIGTEEGNDDVADSGEQRGQTGSNTLRIDFDALAEEAPNDIVADMHRYFKTSGVTQKNEYTGIFEGYNLILITAEGFSPYAVHEELTPTLYKLTHEGFVFENFYTPLWGVSTSDGEYVACTGLLPKSGVWSFYRSGENAMPFGFGNQFGRIGYQCRAYHNHTFDYYNRDISHPNMGYDYKGVGNGLEVKETWPESDLEMMEVTTPEYIGEEPFHTYYMTVSGHLYYTFTGNSMAYKNRALVADLPYSESAQAYIACNIELDRALEHLIAELEAAGIADRTVIALSADHYPYGLEKEVLDELAGHEVEENFELYRNHFILWTASMKEPVYVDKAACSMDIAPTLCNLFGLDYDSRLYMGRDILSKEHKGLVIFGNRSFITDKVMYNSMTGETTLLTEEELPEGYLKQMNKIVNNKFQYSARILEQDYYQYILPYIK